MITILIIGTLFPILFGIVQGVILNKKLVENKVLFHGWSLALNIAVPVGLILYVHFNKPYMPIWDLALVLSLSKIFWFDGVVNKMIGKRWFYTGTTSVWDKFIRIDYVDYIPGTTWWWKCIKALATFVNLVIAGAYMIGGRLLGIVAAVLYCIKLINLDYLF